jgi:hypothetical protein
MPSIPHGKPFEPQTQRAGIKQFRLRFGKEQSSDSLRGIRRVQNGEISRKQGIF